MTYIYFIVHSDGDTSVVSYLLKEAHCNVNCTTNNGRTPITFVDSLHMNTIMVLIGFGANAKDVYSKLQQRYSKQPAESATKVFMLGYPGAGKTTLTTALKVESVGAMSSLVNRWLKVSGIQLRTAGIVPHDIQSDKFGRLTLYDFAGHEEFYAGHDSFLRNAVSGDSAAVFVVVVDLRMSDEVFAQTLLFWLSFIQNQYSSADSKSHVIIAGSHADEVKSKTQEASAKHKVIDSLLFTSTFSGLHFAGFVALNCRYAESSAMTELRQILAQSCEALKIKAEISCISHCFLLYLLDKFRKTPGVTLHHVLNIFQNKSAADEQQLVAIFPDSIPTLSRLCEELNCRGNLLFLKNGQDIQNSWIVLDQGALLSRVSGTIFAPEGFQQHQDITTTSTGVVPLSKITMCTDDSSGDLHPDLIAQFLCHLEFCHEITDHNLLPLLETSSSSSPPMERWFFFPALVSIKEPDKVWEACGQFNYHFGWMLQCSQPEHFFLPRFLQVLLLRLAFFFALSPDTPDSDSSLPVIQRRCSVWKNGISWANRHGVEALVEVVENSRRVNVMLRCRKDADLKCAQLRSAVITKVLEAKKEFCPKISVTEFFVTPTDAACYPLKPSEDALITATEVARAIIEPAPYVATRSGKTINLNDLLRFEPYTDIGEHLLHRLFYEQNLQDSDTITDEYFLHVSDRIHHKLDHFIDLFKTSSTQLDMRMEQRPGGSPLKMVEVLRMWREKHGILSKGTYQTLRSELDQFSIFAGRNPLVCV